MKSRGSGNHKLLVFALAAAAVLLVAGLAGEYATGGPAGKLPAVAQFAQRQLAPSPLVDSESVTVPPRLFVDSGGHVEAYDGEAVLRGDQGPAYCVYELGPFIDGDELTGITVDASAVEGYEYDYRLLVADFASGSWREAPLSFAGEIKGGRVPEGSRVLNSGGLLYLALTADLGAAVLLNGLECSFNLARGPAAEIKGGQLPREITGVPVAIPLTALDANGRIARGFNERLTISAGSGRQLVRAEAEFKQGQARPSLTFHAAGTYQLALTGAAERLNGPVGSMELYSTDLPVYSIQLDPAALEQLNADPYSNEIQSGAICLGDSPWLEAELRFRGGSRRAAAKKSWKVKLSEAEYADADWDTSRKTLNLVADCQDTTMMREKLSYDLVQDLGVPVPRTRYIHLRVNDVFQGLYVDVENPRREWLQAMGLDDRGSLYKASFGQLAAYATAADLETRYEKQTREDEDYSDLAELCRRLDELNYLEDEQAYQGLSQLFDVEQLTDYFVALTLISSRENWICNYYVYHDVEGTGKWLIFPWDMDMTWGVDGEWELKADQALDQYRRTSALASLFFGNRRLQTGFYLALAEALRTTFTEERISQRIDDYHSAVAGDVAADVRKKPLKQDYELYLQGLKGYVRHRGEFVRHELERLVSADAELSDADGAWSRFGRGGGPGG